MTKTYDIPDDEKGYNGWTNYETWCVNLWLTNDQGTYNEVNDLLAVRRNSVSGHVDTLREFVEELAEQTCPGVIDGASFVVDLFRGALSEVNWLEIVENWKED